MSLSLTSVMLICLRAQKSDKPLDSRPCEFDEDAIMSTLRMLGHRYVYDAATDLVLLPRCVFEKETGNIQFYALAHISGVCSLRQEGCQLVVDFEAAIPTNVGVLFAKESIGDRLEANEIFNCEFVVPEHKLRKVGGVLYVYPEATPPLAVFQPNDMIVV